MFIAQALQFDLFRALNQGSAKDRSPMLRGLFGSSRSWLADRSLGECVLNSTPYPVRRVSGSLPNAQTHFEVVPKIRGAGVVFKAPKTGFPLSGFGAVGSLELGQRFTKPIPNPIQTNSGEAGFCQMLPFG